MTRDAVAFAVWPDESEPDARANLRGHLHHLTTTLPQSAVPYVVTHEDGWNTAADVWFDVDVFERFSAADERLTDTVALYDGDLLPGVYDDWVFAIRDRLRRSYLAALETLMLRSRSRRDFALAKGYATSILHHDPWREDTLRHFASICYESGDRAGALREIDAFAGRLAAEMHIEPMPETAALRARILRGGALAGVLGAAAADPAAAGGRFPFVGRAAEHEYLASAWRRAARGRGDVVFVGGDAGIGKTRLIEEMAILAEVQGGRVLRGATSEAESIPYAAFVEVLRDALPLLRTLDVRPFWLVALLRRNRRSRRRSRSTFAPCVGAFDAASLRRSKGAIRLGGRHLPRRRRPLEMSVPAVQREFHRHAARTSRSSGFDARRRAGDFLSKPATGAASRYAARI